jgi:hypothetical protein
MVPESSLLVTRVRLVDRIPLPPAPAKRGRGRPPHYAERLFRKALLIMIVKHLHSPCELLTVLAQDTAEMAALRQELTQEGRYPCRRTWERRRSGRRGGAWRARDGESHVGGPMTPV